MFFALKDGQRILADPGGRAACPSCEAPVLAKCGTVICWHWAHQAGEDCDPWSESVGPWHVRWQSAAPAERQEVIIGRHRADILTAQNTVVEVQDAGVSEDTIAEREAYYGDMAWIFNAIDAFRWDRLNIRYRKNDGYVTFRWKQPRRTIRACRQRVYLDLGNGEVLRVEKLYDDKHFSGWGHLVPEETIRRWIAGPDYLQGVSPA